MSAQEKKLVTLCEIINKASPDKQEAVQDKLENILIGFNLGWDARIQAEHQNTG